MRKKLRRPSPGLVVAIIALFVALGGTSYAAIVSLPLNSVGTAQLKSGAVTAGKINASARLHPVIYAHVYANGYVDKSQSNGITISMLRWNFTSYCFSHLPFTPKGGSATIDYGHAAAGNTELAELQITTGVAKDCSTGEHVEVATSDAPGDRSSEGFYLVLYG